MRISSKGRYGLAAMLVMAQSYHPNQCVTILSIAEKLGISKIYLEQVFALLKRADLVTSIKGAQGGYQLTKPLDQITVGEILLSIETSLFEKTESSVLDEAVEKTMNQMVWQALDDTLITTLNSITLAVLKEELSKYSPEESYMFYI